MLYLAVGAADVLLETGDETLLPAILAHWKSMTERRSYVSGGLGARYEGEAFGKDYELPAEHAYTETCAAIASVMWNYRLLLLTGEALCRRDGAYANQCRGAGAVARGRRVFLPKSPRRRRHAPAAGRVRMRVLPAECRAAPRPVARLLLRYGRRERCVGPAVRARVADPFPRGRRGSNARNPSRARFTVPASRRTRRASLSPLPSYRITPGRTARRERCGFGSGRNNRTPCRTALPWNPQPLSPNPSDS